MPRHRESFDTVARAYAVARPPYPGPLVEAIAEQVSHRPDPAVLEIGPGTGLLTVPLAALGIAVTGVELGPELARVARERLSRFPRARVVVADFDTWSPPQGGFDLIVAATAYHWLDPTTRISKCLEALRPAGRIAIVDTRWGVAGVGDDFTMASQNCHARWDPEHDPGYHPRALDDGVDRSVELQSTGDLRVVRHERFPVHRTYTASEYAHLLSTFSNVVGLPPERRAGFLACIRCLAEERFDDRIERLDVYDLWGAERTAPTG